MLYRVLLRKLNFSIWILRLQNSFQTGPQLQNGLKVRVQYKMKFHWKLGWYKGIFLKFDLDKKQQQLRISLLYNILFTHVSYISTLANKMFPREQQFTTRLLKVIVLLVGVGFFVRKGGENANWVNSLLAGVNIY